jgi:hypothetical protein
MPTATKCFRDLLDISLIFCKTCLRCYFSIFDDLVFLMKKNNGYLTIGVASGLFILTVAGLS